MSNYEIRKVSPFTSDWMKWEEQDGVPEWNENGYAYYNGVLHIKGPYYNDRSKNSNHAFGLIGALNLLNKNEGEYFWLHEPDSQPRMLMYSLRPQNVEKAEAEPIIEQPYTAEKEPGLDSLVPLYEKEIKSGTTHYPRAVKLRSNIKYTVAKNIIEPLLEPYIMYMAMMRMEDFDAIYAQIEPLIQDEYLILKTGDTIVVDRQYIISQMPVVGMEFFSSLEPFVLGQQLVSRGFTNLSAATKAIEEELSYTELIGLEIMKELIVEWKFAHQFLLNNHYFTPEDFQDPDFKWYYFIPYSSNYPKFAELLFKMRLANWDWNPLYDPITGNLMDQSTSSSSAKGKSKTPSEPKPTDGRPYGERLSELFVKAYAEYVYYKEVWNASSNDGYVAMALNTEFTLTRRTDNDIPKKPEFSTLQWALLNHQNREEKYTKARQRYISIGRAYVLNEDPAYISRNVFASLVEGVAEATFWDDYEINKDYAIHFVETLQSVGYEVTEAQLSAGKPTLWEEIFHGVGASLPSMVELMVTSALTSGIGGVVAGLGKLAEGTKLYKQLRVLFGSTSIGRRSMVILRQIVQNKEFGKVLHGAISFELAGIGWATGLGESATELVWDQWHPWNFLVKLGPVGKYLHLFVKVAVKSIGATIGEFAGELAENIRQKGGDFKAVIEATFGKDWDSAWHKIAVTSAISVMFSSTTTTVFFEETRKELASNYPPKGKEAVHQEVLGKIDGILAGRSNYIIDPKIYEGRLIVGGPLQTPKKERKNPLLVDPEELIMADVRAKGDNLTWDEIRAAFGSDKSKAADNRLKMAWLFGWRPGEEIPDIFRDKSKSEAIDDKAEGEIDTIPKLPSSESAEKGIDLTPFGRLTNWAFEYFKNKKGEGLSLEEFLEWVQKHADKEFFKTLTTEDIKQAYALIFDLRKFQGARQTSMGLLLGKIDDFLANIPSKIANFIRAALEGTATLMKGLVESKSRWIKAFGTTAFLLIPQVALAAGSRIGIDGISIGSSLAGLSMCLGIGAATFYAIRGTTQAIEFKYAGKNLWKDLEFYARAFIEFHNFTLDEFVQWVAKQEGSEDITKQDLIPIYKSAKLAAEHLQGSSSALVNWYESNRKETIPDSEERKKLDAIFGAITDWINRHAKFETKHTRLFGDLDLYFNQFLDLAIQFALEADPQNPMSILANLVREEKGEFKKLKAEYERGINGTQKQLEAALKSLQKAIKKMGRKVRLEKKKSILPANEANWVNIELGPYLKQLGLPETWQPDPAKYKESVWDLVREREALVEEQGKSDNPSGYRNRLGRLSERIAEATIDAMFKDATEMGNNVILIYPPKERLEERSSGKGDLDRVFLVESNGKYKIIEVKGSQTRSAGLSDRVVYNINMEGVWGQRFQQGHFVYLLDTLLEMKKDPAKKQMAETLLYQLRQGNVSYSKLIVKTVPEVDQVTKEEKIYMEVSSSEIHEEDIRKFHKYLR